MAEKKNAGTKNLDTIEYLESLVAELKAIPQKRS